MPELDDAALERRLRGVLKEHLGALPLELTVYDLARRRKARGVARRFGRGRDITLFAAAALLLVGGALVAGSGLLRLPSVVPPVPAPSAVAVATASPDATLPSPPESVAPPASPIPVAGPGGVWIQTGSMVTPRDGHAAVQLLDGRVLVMGGRTPADGHELTSAELYDPVSGTWSGTGSMLKPRFGFAPTLLLDGTVLVGDSGEAADVQIIGSEVYDPASGTWSSAGKVFTPSRSVGSDGSTATLLRDGKVLVAGGTGAKLYDPDSGSWSATGPMIAPRYDHTATLLRDGSVLVAGGDQVEGSCGQMECHPMPPEAELYHPDTASWTAVPMGAAAPSQRFGWWASLLRDGTLLLIGDSANLFDPTRGTWSTPAGWPEPGYPKALLPDDTVLLAVEGPSCTAAVLYDPRSGSSTSASNRLRCESAMGQPPLYTPLRDGTVLASGGSQCSNDGDLACAATGTAELYVPAGVSPPPLPAFLNPSPPVFPNPTPTPTPAPPRPPEAGPVPPKARSWTVTVDNRSSEPATLFVADGDDAESFRLVGSATPNVVPAGATMKVTFRFPAKGGPDGGWITVNPRLDEGADVGSVGADNIGMPGKILITEECGGCWVGPAQ
jgi:Kelch motif